MRDTTVFILAGAGVAVFLIYQGAQSARKRIDQAVSAAEDPRGTTKDALQGIHDGVSDYFEDNWPTTSGWYNWWNSNWWSNTDV